jgi:hypothetical protein
MATKPIPQIDFDKAVQRILSLGLSRIAAENIVIQFWQISIDQNLNFKALIDKATSSGKLDVDQSVLDGINLTLPNTIKYYKSDIRTISPIAAREL